MQPRGSLDWFGMYTSGSSDAPLDPETRVWLQRREDKLLSASLRRCCVVLLRFPGKCNERSAPTAILHNSESARERDVGVCADSSAPHATATVKRFGIRKTWEALVNNTSSVIIKPGSSLEEGWFHHQEGWTPPPSLTEMPDVYIYQGTPVSLQARQLDAIRPAAKVKPLFGDSLFFCWQETTLNNRFKKTSKTRKSQVAF